MKTALHILLAITALATAALYGMTESPMYVFWTLCGLFLLRMNGQALKDIEEEEQ